jgi:peptidoglycan/xylan/chitin deacetylase (PgdA/CDA1 family)
MAGRFMLTFDCEGKWGCADSLSESDRRSLTDENLRHAYASILQLLDHHRVEATFAFSGAFSQSPSAFERLRPHLEEMSLWAPDYLGPALQDIAQTKGDGWHGDQLVEATAKSRTAHEIALHGVTHVPWTRLDRSFVQKEMELFEMLEGPVKASRTFVYPRNQIAHEAVLAKQGFIGFRAARAGRSRLASLFSEFNLSEEPEQSLPGNGIIRIPAGFFLNWRSGPRRLVPAAVTCARARRLLRRAAATGGIVHYWLHPENIATAPSTFELLGQLVQDVAAARDAGDCQILTQLGYCRSHQDPGG